jgi:predicted Zn-dependent peptidase
MAFETHTITPGFQLHVKSTRQFKTTKVRIFLSRNLDNDTTRAALLPYILRRGTRNHPTMTRISRHLENLYGTAVGTDVSKMGEWQILSFVADVPCERYLPGSMPVLKRIFEFLSELIFLPAGEKKFVQKYFRTEKKNMADFILSLKEKKAAYALERLFQLMCPGEPFSRYEYGELDELRKVEPEALHKFYERMCKCVHMDVYVLGDVEAARVLRCVEKAFPHGSLRVEPLRPAIVKTARRKPLQARESDHVVQGRLLMGYRSHAPFNSAASRALAVAVAILGGFPHSKLFRVVREKASLAYSVSSHLVRTKGIAVAYAGVEPGNEEEARHLIENQIHELQAGRITKFELDSTRTSILDDLASITDSPSREIDFHFVHMLHGEQLTPEEAARQVSEMSKEEIVSAAGKLKLDTVFVLTGFPLCSSGQAPAQLV